MNSLDQGHKFGYKFEAGFQCVARGTRVTTCIMSSRVGNNRVGNQDRNEGTLSVGSAPFITPFEISFPSIFQTVVLGTRLKSIFQSDRQIKYNSLYLIEATYQPIRKQSAGLTPPPPPPRSMYFSFLSVPISLLTSRTRKPIPLHFNSIH